MTNVVPKAAPNFWDTKRAKISVVPPAGNATK
jgi:hypothetical protein